MLNRPAGRWSVLSRNFSRDPTVRQENSISLKLLPLQPSARRRRPPPRLTSHRSLSRALKDAHSEDDRHEKDAWDGARPRAARIVDQTSPVFTKSMNRSPGVIGVFHSNFCFVCKMSFAVLNLLPPADNRTRPGTTGVISAERRCLPEEEKSGHDPLS